MAGVEFAFELPYLGREDLVGDRVENLLVANGGIGAGVDEVELDLQPGERAFEVETGLAEHPAEDVEAGAQLLAVALAVCAGKGGRADFFSHVCFFPPALRDWSGEKYGAVGVR